MRLAVRQDLEGRAVELDRRQAGARRRRQRQRDRRKQRVYAAAQLGQQGLEGVLRLKIKWIELDWIVRSCLD